MRTVMVQTTYKSKTQVNSKGKPKLFTSGQKALQVPVDLKEATKIFCSEPALVDAICELMAENKRKELRAKLAEKVDQKKNTSRTDAEMVVLDD